MIVESQVRLLAREHNQRPLRGSLLQLGRQTVALVLDKAIEVLESEHVRLDPGDVSAARAMSADETTRFGKETGFVSDVAFFRLFGLTDVQAMDVSTYENAEVIQNLNFPIPDSLAGRYDFILDGGTFDHLFDLKTAFANLTHLLNVGGRILMWNGISNFTGDAYISMAPDFFRDYLLINRWVNPHVYVAEMYNQGQKSHWRLYEYGGADEFEGKQRNDRFLSPFILMSIVRAEKGPDTVADQMPVQVHYRDEALRRVYRQVEQKARSANGAIERMGTGGFWRYPYELAQIAARTVKRRIVVTSYRYIGRL